MEPWKALLQHSLTNLQYELTIYRARGDKTDVLQSNKTIKTIEYGEEYEPTLLIEDDMLQALAEALHEKGINPKKEYVQGKLEATESHLQDMRVLLKLKP